MSYQNGFMGQNMMFPQQGFNSYGGGPYGGAGGGGGGRGRGRRDDRRGRGRGGHGGHNDRSSVPESSNVRMRKMIIKFAEEEDFHPIEDPPRLARALRRQWKEGSSGILDGFRIGVTQEPHKHPHYVSLLTHLFRNPLPNPDGDQAGSVKIEVDQEIANTGDKRKAEDEVLECGQEVIEDLARGFRGWVEAREWLNMRLALQFFSSLVPAGLVTAHSLLEVYRALLSVLDEVGGGGDRAERVIRAVSEGLMRSGQTLSELFPEDVERIIAQIENAISSRRNDKALSDPFNPILAQGQEKESLSDQLDDLLSALHALRQSGYASPESLPQHYLSIPPVEEGLSQSEPYSLTAISMPPEMYDLDESREGLGEGKTGRLVFFGEDIVAPPSTPNGWVLRSLVLDIVTLFEVNRKECARILLALRTFVTPNTFKPAQPTEGSASTLSLESLVISTLLSTMFALPLPPHPLIYYAALITELCKASPNTVAPPVGRSVRKLFGFMGTEGLDYEIMKRAGEWFAVHLSNFGFQWMWKEWIPELELPTGHPKRAFMRRVVDMEVRLAYHDRVLQTLPEPMLEPSAGVVSPDAPDPVWPYEDADHPLHVEAVELLKLYRQKTPANDVRAHLLTLPNASSGPGEPLAKAITLMATETLLHLGSRSFSHFLNATERYLDLLRSLSPDPASRQTILQGVSLYWRRSGQMRLVTIDKYLQYGVLEGQDVIEWVFGEEDGVGGEEADGWTDGFKWEVLAMCLDKSVGRVSSVKRRVRMVEREDEAARARRAAEKLERGEGVGEDEDVEPAEVRLERSKEARDAQISLDIQMTKLESIILTTTRHFVTALCPWVFNEEEQRGQGLKAVIQLLDSGIEGAWRARCVLGWYRHYLRKYADHVRPLSSVIDEKVFGGFKGGESVEGRAEDLVRGIWTG